MILLLGKMVYFWNVIHYVVYRWEVVIQSFFDKYIIKLFIPSFLGKKWKRNLELGFRQKDENFNNSKVGINVTQAGIHMGSIIVLFEASIFNFYQKITNRALYVEIYENIWIFILFIFCGLLLPGVWNYFFLFKNDKYIVFFKQFEKQYNENKILYNICVFCFLLFTLLLVVYSFVLFASI